MLAVTFAVIYTSNMSNLGQRHSFYGEVSLNDSQQSKTSWKSDVNISTTPEPKTGGCCTFGVSKCSSTYRDSNSVNSYYKKYEHDMIPVKEDYKLVNSGFHEIEAGDCPNVTLTNSELEKLEKKIYNTISEELQTDVSSVSSLESNIKFFKTTVLEIFDNFYASMRDFEVYKNRFEEILAKNKIDAVGDMESFIKDMINHIMSSDSNINHEVCKRVENSTAAIKNKDVRISSSTSSATNKKTLKLLESLHSVVEAYKNEHYQTDSPFEDHSINASSIKKEEILNIYLLSGAPCVQIRRNDRNLLSEINIQNTIRAQNNFHVASAENLKKLSDKKQELEEYVKQQELHLAPDREIPVKASFARKNIYLDEDFTHEREKDEKKSFISKICNYICKKLRRN